jgi:hypothetical protein
LDNINVRVHSPRSAKQPKTPLESIPAFPQYTRDTQQA